MKLTNTERRVINARMREFKLFMHDHGYVGGKDNVAACKLFLRKIQGKRIELRQDDGRDVSFTCIAGVSDNPTNRRGKFTSNPKMADKQAEKAKHAALMIAGLEQAEQMKHARLLNLCPSTSMKKERVAGKRVIVKHYKAQK